MLKFDIMFLRWSALSLVSYLLFRHIIDCDISNIVAKTHEGSPLPESRTLNDHEYIDRIDLTEVEKAEVIRHYSIIEKHIKVKDGCAIGAGYTTCMDVGFRAIDMFKALEHEVAHMRKA